MLSCDRSSARNVGLPANNPQEQRKTCNQVQMGDTVGKSLQDMSTYMPAVFESRDLSYRIKHVVPVTLLQVRGSHFEICVDRCSDTYLILTLRRSGLYVV